MHLAPTYVEQGFDNDDDGEDDDGLLAFLQRGPHVDESNHLTHLPRGITFEFDSDPIISY